jgi:hypothetical protein
MTSPSSLDLTALERLPLKSYFKTVESMLKSSNTLGELTDFFTIEPFTDSKPYLTTRKLIPLDKRFKTIELVYKDSTKVDAIVWEIDITLSELIDIFGNPIIHNEPYSDSTAFAFQSDNPCIEIIKTRHPKWLTKVDGKESFEYEDQKQKKEVTNPEFSFIQFSLAS